ncbi:hypothetical protein [Denitromonas ohlonensis]|uniref:hypothetical protein n=1 Tax=Denitromonas ohlonensis TaxID=3078508 RepID=UPI001642C00E|nr:hypothetical protein [Denitromonas ohlonensis]
MQIMRVCITPSISSANCAIQLIFNRFQFIKGHRTEGTVKRFDTFTGAHCPKVNLRTPAGFD